MIMQRLMRKISLLSVCTALAASLILVPVASAATNADTTAWYPFGMGGNGFIGTIDMIKGGPGEPYNVAVGEDTGGAWISLDQGDSFIPIGETAFKGDNVATRTQGHIVTFDPNDSSRKTVFVGTNNFKIMKSDLSTEGSYSLLTKYTATKPFAAIEFAPSNPQVAYALTGDKNKFYKLYKKDYPLGKAAEVIKSTDGGNTWTNLGPVNGVPANICGMELVVHPTDPNTLWVTTDKGLYKSTNGGASFSQIGNTGTNKLPHNSVYSLAVDQTNASTMYVTLFPYSDLEAYSDDEVAYVQQHPANEGGVYKSTDGGANWTKMNLGFNPPPGTWDTAGHFWQIKMSSLNSNRVYVAYQEARDNTASAVYRTTDGGSSWTKLNNFTYSFVDKFLPEILELYPESTTNDHVFVSGITAGHYKSTDSGANFAPFTTSAAQPGFYRGWGMEAGRGKYISVDKSDPSKMFYAECDRGLWRSLDYGHTWSNVVNPDNGTVGKGRGILPDPDNSNIVYGWAAYRDYGFNQFLIPPAPAPVPAHFYKSTDGGATFSQPGLNGVPEKNIWDLVLDPTTLSSGSVNAQRTLYAAVGDSQSYRLKAFLDTANKTFDLYLNEELVLNDKPYTDPQAGAVDKLEFKIDSNNKGAFFVDNISAKADDGTLLFNPLYTFEGDTTGNAPSGWTANNTGGGLTKVSEISSATGKNVKINAPANADSAGISKTFASQSGIVEISFEVILDDMANDKTINIYSGSNIALQLAFKTAGTQYKLKYKKSDGTFDSLGSTYYAEDRFHHRGVYKSTDGGSNWTDISSGLPGGGFFTHILIDPNDPSTLYLNDELNYGGVYKKTGSSDWTKIFNYETGAIGVIDSGTTTTLLAASNDPSSGGIYKSTDGGSTWTLIKDASAQKAADPYFVYWSIDTLGTSEIVASSSHGVIRSTDGGGTWSDFNERIPYGSSEFVKIVNDSLGKRYYVAMKCEGFAERFALPYTVLEYKRKGLEDFLYKQKRALPGVQAYFDGAYSINTIPSSMGGSMNNNLYLFTTSMGDVNDSSANLTTVKVDSTSNVYVAVPQNAVPSWLSSNNFVKQTDTLTLTHRSGTTKTMDVWKKSPVSANTLVTLGGLKNGNTTGDVNYLIFLEKNSPAFADDFEDGNSTGWTVDSGAFNVVTDGSSKAYQAVNTSTARSYAGQNSWTNYSVEAKVKSGTWSETAGIVARYQNTNNYYSFYYKPAVNKLAIAKYVGGVRTELADINLTLANGAYYNFKFEVNGTTLKGYLDGVEKLSITDNTFTSGYPGVESKSQATYFDDVIVNLIP